MGISLRSASYFTRNYNANNSGDAADTFFFSDNEAYCIYKAYSNDDLQLLQATVVTLYANGGSFSDANTKTVQLPYGSTISAITDTPTWAGHTLLGWAESSGATTALDSSTPISNGERLYAVWSTPLTAANTSLSNDSATYTGSNQTIPSVIYNRITLTKDTDYTLSISNGATGTSIIKDAATYTLTITPTGKYSGDPFIKTFTVNKKDLTLTWDTTTDTTPSFTYDGSPHAPTAELSGAVNGETVTVAVSGEQTDVGSYSATANITCSSNYNQPTNTTQSFTITAKTVNSPTITLSPSSYTYNGSANEPTVTVKDNSTEIPASEYTVSYSNNTNAGTATVTVTDKNGGNYTVNGSNTFTISAKSVTPTVTLSQTSYTYDGSAKKPTVTVKDGDTVIDSGEYTVSYSNNTNAGTATVTVTDNSGGNYSFSTKTANFTINPMSITATVTVPESSYTYTGSEIKPPVTVKYGDIVFTADDYSVAYSANTDIGTATVTVSDRDGGNYIISGTATFAITQQSADPAVTLSQYSYEYNGAARTPDVTSVMVGNVVIDPSQYNISYSGNTDAGTATVRVTSKNTCNYSFDTTVNFMIERVQLGLSWSNTALTYNRSSQKPTVEVTGLVGSETCTVRVSGAQTNAGTYTATATINFNGTTAKEGNYIPPADMTTSFTINKKTVTPTVTLSETSHEYDGAEHKPNVTVNDGDNVIPVTEYVVSYSGDFTNVTGNKYVLVNNKNDGNYTVVNVEVPFSITKAPATIDTAPVGQDTIYYDGEPQTLLSSLGTATGGTIKYSLNDEDYSADEPTATALGNYTVYYTLDPDSNHSYTGGTHSLTVSIIKKKYPNYIMVSRSVPIGTSDSISIEEDVQTQLTSVPGLTFVGGTIESVGSVSSVLTGTPAYNSGTKAVDFTLKADYSLVENGVPAIFSFKVENEYYYPVTVVVMISPVGVSRTISFAVGTGSPAETPPIEDKKVTLTYGTADTSYRAATDGSNPFTYSSDNEEVATVASDGTLTLNGVGTARITAHCDAEGVYGPVEDYYLLKVVPKPVTVALTANDKPYDPDDMTVTFASGTSSDFLTGDDVSVSVTGAVGQISSTAVAGDSVTVTSVTGVSLTGAKSGCYVIGGYAEPVTVRVTKKAHPDVTVTTRENFGNTGELSLASYIEAGGRLDAESVSKTDSHDIIDTYNFDSSTSTLTFKMRDISVYAGYNATLSINVTDCDNYENYMLTVDIVMLNKEYYDISLTEISDFVYGDGSTFDLMEYLSGTDRSVVEKTDFTVTGAEYDPTTGIMTVSNVGEVEVELHVDGGREHYDLDRCRYFTVSPREVTLNWGSTSLVYNGEVQYPAVTLGNLISGDDVTPNVIGAGMTPIDAGTGYEALVNSLDGAKSSCYVLPGDRYRSFAIIPRPVTVTITGNNAAVDYNGELQSVTGYTAAISDPLYTEAYFSPGSALAEASGINADTVYMGLTAGIFTNNNSNFDVTFDVAADGYLTIAPINVTVTITGNSNTADYDGEAHTVTGYTAAASSELYDVDNDFTFSGEATAARTNAGTTDMGLAASQFTNINPNFATVTFDVTDGYQTINKVDVTVTIVGENNTADYDGAEHTVTGYTATASSELYDVDNDFTFSGEATAARTNAGTTDMGLTASQFTNINPNFLSDHQ